VPRLYGELRRLARGILAGQRPGHTLQPTALVHEAYLKLADHGETRRYGRTHFMALAARAMRHILVDHARGHARGKRGGAWRRVTLTDGLEPAGKSDLDRDQLLALERALERLQAVDEREARVVELRFFGGLTMVEIAEALDVSLRSVEADWTHARAWLRRDLSGEGL